MPIEGFVRQTLHCNNCKDWLRLEYKPFNETVDGIRIVTQKMPLLVCPSCKSEFQPDWTKIHIMWIIEESKKRKTTRFEGTKRAKNGTVRYDICPELNFKYDSNDCKIIPGLEPHLAKKGFFTPVFFDKKVLHKYLSFDEYEVHVAGNTYGTIYFKDGNYLSYGINRNGKLFCWLGDIEEVVPEAERHYLLSENVESDHDVASEFYAAQIEAEFTELSYESMLLEQRLTFEVICKNKDNFKIFDYEKDEYELLEEMTRPVNWNEKGITYIINSLTKLCIESIDSKNLRIQIKKLDDSIDLGDAKSIKLLEKWIELRIKYLDASEITKPFFVLYDFRIILDHKMNESRIKETLEFCYKRLGITTDKSFETLYDKLIGEITNSYSKLASSFANP